MKLKVFGGLIIHKGKQVRTIVATTSQQKAADLVGVSVGHLRDYWSVTGNTVELETALAKPNTVFVSDSTFGKDFVELEK